MITRSDYLWVLVGLGVLSVAVLLQSRAIAQLQDDVAFTKLAASAAFTQEMKPLCHPATRATRTTRQAPALT